MNVHGLFIFIYNEYSETIYMAVVRGSSAIPVGGSFNPAGNVPLDARLWVDTIDDLKELVDYRGENDPLNYSNPIINVGALVYVEDEDAHYRIVGDGHNNVIGYAKWQVSTNVVFQEEEPTDKDVLWVSESDNSAAEWHTEENIISNMQNRITELENQVEKLLAILRYGAIAGDSTIGGRTSIMDTAPVCTNPTTNDKEDTWGEGMAKPSSLLATIPNLVIKHDTAQRFKDNYQNLVNGELIWIQEGSDINVDDPGLYMYSANKLYVGFIPLAGGTGGGGGTIVVTGSVNFDTTTNILDILSQTSNVVDGILDITDTNNFKVEDGILYITTGQSTENQPGTNPGGNDDNKVNTEVSEDGTMEIESKSGMYVDNDGYLVIEDISLLEEGYLNL